MLLRACRGALLGSPVADDFAFLYRIAFHHPLDLLDSMGATFYWRPMSRQLYFSLVGGAVLARPWVASAVNAALLLALGALLYRIARRGMAPPVAATIALFPLLAEPARALLAWPSGAQHLLAAVGAALALHEALAGRLVTAAAAALAGVLSHESAALVLPGLPLVAWFRTRDRRETALWAGAAAAVAALWMAGYAIARHHGVAMPPRVGGLSLIGRLPRLLLLALTATLNLEEAPSDVYLTVVLGTLALIAIAVVLIVRGHRVRATAKAVGPAALWFAVGIIPLAVLLPDWNAWRAFVPTVGLGFALTALLGAGSSWLAAGFMVLRLVALLNSMAAPAVVWPGPPPTASHMSFPRIARLQRIVESTRREMERVHPRLEPGSSVRYWSLPRMAEVGYMESRALRVWYRDTTLAWARFGGNPGLKTRVDALVEFSKGEPFPAYVIEPDALRLYLAGSAAMMENRYVTGESLMVASGLAHHRNGSFRGVLARNRAFMAYNQKRYGLADSLALISARINDDDPEAWAMAAATAYAAGDSARAAVAVRRALTIDPQNAFGLRVAKALRIP